MSYQKQGEDLMANNVKPLNIALIGCGKMGSALLNGWIESDVENRVHVLDPNELPKEFEDFSPNPVTAYKTAEDFIAAGPAIDVFVLAVKPQVMEAVCNSIAPAIPHNVPIISIAAGQTIDNFEKWFGTTQPIVRAMPNTPALVHKAMTGAVANSQITPEQKSAADQLLSSVGKVQWHENEDIMDAITAISGSGPAYFFRFTEALAEAGEKLGLPKEKAMELARATFEGAAALASSKADTPISTLRENVTSPGGTTAAALDAFNKDGNLQKVVDKATAAAQKRGRELSL